MYNGTNKIKISATRVEALGYANTNPAGVACWRVVDLHHKGREACVGAVYATKGELLADFDRYAATWGY